MHGQHEGLHWHRVVHHADKIPVLFSFAFAMSTVPKNHISVKKTRKRPKPSQVSALPKSLDVKSTTKADRQKKLHFSNSAREDISGF